MNYSPTSDKILHQSDETGRNKQSTDHFTFTHVVLAHANCWRYEKRNSQVGHEHWNIVLRVLKKTINPKVILT